MPVGPTSHTSHTEAGLPTRRTFELIVITIVLMAPALSMVQLWAKKHLVTTATAATADVAQVVTEIL
jgi:hypothetical protein